jgi:hypothetical protein
MELEKITSIVHSEWKRDHTIHISHDSNRIHQGTELMKELLKQRFINEFNSITEKKHGMTRGMFALDEKRILAIIESI